jgi:hypothetical protein
MKVKYDFKLEDLIPDVEIARGKKSEVVDSVKDYILEQVLLHVAEGKSPVAGHGKFKKLDKDYAERKDEEGGTVLAGRGSNLELTGALMSSLKITKRGNKMTLTVERDQQDKADGHNNFSGDSKLPIRRFIPFAEEEETFNAKIIEGVRKIVEREGS